MGESDDLVPAMGAAIEARRLELGMTPTHFADASGLSRPQLQDVRKGLRKRYQDVTEFGVARALRWRSDAIDRLLEGLDPIEIDDVGTGQTDLVTAMLRFETELAELRARVAEQDAEVRALRAELS